ncbi:MAG: S-methyl-5'-thioadenosine phosphorylase [Candidatus Methanofastidiosia archaeon]
MNRRVALIGGTGIYHPIFKRVKEKEVETLYGKVKLKVGFFRSKEVFFLPRHGEKHSIPPHKINYRANLLALKNLKVERILASSAVGSLNPQMKPSDFVLLDQFIDFTKVRPLTLFENKVIHIDLREPYCPEIRKTILKASKELGTKIHENGTYVCTEGPRFETPKEIEMFKRLGGDLVGMTNVPEVVLAREAEICYATVATVTNWACGISKQKLTHIEVSEIMEKNMESLRKLFIRTIELMPEERTCDCGSSLKGAVV